LEAISVTLIDYAFAGEAGKSYRQTLSPAVTYASIPDVNKTVSPEPQPEPQPTQPKPEAPADPKQNGGGCNAAWPAWLVFACVPLIFGKKR
jgi:hypothetical protein